jgi:hypothetical protein
MRDALLDRFWGQWKRNGPTVAKLYRRWKEELDATETKVFHDRDEGVIYSDALVAWKVRQEARRDAMEALGVLGNRRMEIKAEVKLDIADRLEQALRRAALAREDGGTAGTDG